MSQPHQVLRSAALRQPIRTAPIDFRRSLPPSVPSVAAHLSAALAQLSRRSDVSSLMRQSIAGGTHEDRVAGAALLAPRLGPDLDLARICATNGTQNTLLFLLRTLVGRHGVLLAERLSYGALPALVRMADVAVHGVEMDEQGILPDAFEAACREQRSKALYCNPTVHNPTTATMHVARRMQIAEIARKHGVAILEDDALGRLHADLPRPIAALAPDITWYVMTMTKCLAQGLRVAYLVMPDDAAARQRLAPFAHMSCWHGAPLSTAITNLWVENGAADEITSHIAAECSARERCAREILSGLNIRSERGSMHIWLDLPEHVSRIDVLDAAERQGVLLRASDVFAVDEHPRANGLRLSLSSPETIEQVREGLHRLINVLDPML